MFSYTSREAYNSCIAMFPDMNSKQHSTANIINAKKTIEAKKSRLEAMKLNRARNRGQFITRHGLPTLNTESEEDIISDIDNYIDDAPMYKVTSNSKINFQTQRQLEFEVNPDIELLHQMFPSVDLAVIYSKYMSCTESLNETIELLLIPTEESSMGTLNFDQWPSLSSMEPVCFPGSGGAISICKDIKFDNSDSDSDMVLVRSRSSSVDSNYSADEWIVVQYNDNENRYRYSCEVNIFASYKDALSSTR
jgi:hypothetical protein